MSLSFAFDPSKGETPQTIAQRRQMSNLIAAQMLGRAPKNVGEGLNAIGQALIARSMMGEADAAQKAGDASLPDFLKPQITGQPATTSIATPSVTATPPIGNLPTMNPPPAAPTTGKIYSNDEPSPLDPPSGADRQAMIATILGEAGNQGPTGQTAVASVIRNRAINGGFGGDTPTGVVTAPNQFEPWNTADGRARMAAAAADPTQRAAADHAIALAYGEGGTAPTDPTNGALNFFSPKAQAALGRPVPTWAQGPGQDIGDHRFFGGRPSQQPYQVAGPAVAAPQPSPDGGVPADNSPSSLDNAQYPAGPIGAPATAAGESPAPAGNAAVAAIPANAQPAQGALPTAQAVQPAAQPQNRFLFKNASDEDLQKALLNPFTPTNIRAALTQEATLRANAAQKAADPMRALDMQSKKLAIKKAEQDLEKPDETFGVVGQDPNTGKSLYGFINTKTGAVRPYNVPQTGNAPAGSLQDAMKAGVTGADLYQYMPPDRAKTVKAMIEGRMPPPSTTAMRSPATMQLIDAANAIDPNFDATTWKTRSTFNQQFGSQLPSSIGGQKVLMGTALGHLGEVAQSAADLGNSDGLGIAKLGYAANYIKNQTTEQAAKVNALNDKVAKFSGEVGKLYSGSQGGGIHEREDTRNRLAGNMTSAELASGLEAARDLIASKQKALEDQAATIFGPEGAKKFDFVGPEGRDALKKIDDSIMKLRGQNPAPSQPVSQRKTSSGVSWSIQ
jgi:spore germination cell wall hydrolase CwlJ-like protein